MIESHPSFREPGAQIWRYMDFTKFVSMLDSRALFFSRLDKLGDRFEGTVSEPTLDAIRASYVGPPEAVNKLVEMFGKRTPDLMRQTLFVNCWHANAFESDAMWKIYVKGNGIAVQSTFQRLKRSLSTATQTLFAGEVEYIDFRRAAMDVGIAFTPALHKKKSFEHEKEVRAVWWDTASVQLINQTGSHPAPDKRGVPVAADLNVLIENVYVAPNADPWFVALVDSVLAKYGLNVKAIPSDL